MICTTSNFLEDHAGKIFRAIRNSHIGHLASAELRDSTIYWAANRVTVLLKTNGFSEANTILGIGQRAKSKNTRGKVYGLVGLLPQAVSNQISPNYALPVEIVYLHLRKAMLDESGRLGSILSWCFSREGSSLPSWVPDWTIRFPHNRVYWIKRRCASALSSSMWTISSNNLNPVCKGFIVDTVKGLSASPEELAPRTNAITSSLPSRYCDKQKAPMALQRTLVVRHDQCEFVLSVVDEYNEIPPDTVMVILSNIYWINWNDIKDMTANNEPLQGIWQGTEAITSSPYWEDFDRFRHTNANFSIFSYQLRDLFSDLPLYPSACESSSVIPNMKTRRVFTNQRHAISRLVLRWKTPKQRDMQSRRFSGPRLTDTDAKNMTLAKISITARRLVTTATGYLGLAPEETSQGYLITILYGCNFPVILHPVGSHYRAIGKCYVDDLMNGESWAAKDRGKYQEIEVSLC